MPPVCRAIRNVSTTLPGGWGAAEVVGDFVSSPPTHKRWLGRKDPTNRWSLSIICVAPQLCPDRRQAGGQLALETAVGGAIELALDAKIILRGHRAG